MFNASTWQDAILSKPKSSFNSSGLVFWKNRCWNCEQEGCNKYKCPKPADKARTDKMSWLEKRKIIRVQRPIQLIIVIVGGRKQHLTNGGHQQVMEGISTSSTTNLIPGMERTPGLKMIPQTLALNLLMSLPLLLLLLLQDRKMLLPRLHS